MMNVLRFKSLTKVAKVAAFSVPLMVAQAVLPTLIQSESVSGVAYAQQEKSKKKEQKTKRTQAMSNKTYEKIQAAQEAVEAKDFAEGIRLLDALRNGSKKLNDAESSAVLNIYAFIYYSQENYGKAIDAYKQIIELKDAPEGNKVAARFSVAQLYFVTEQWQEGIDALNEWIAVSETVGANAYVLLAQGYYQLQKFDLALNNVEKAIGMYKEKGKVPKENWYGLQRFLYYEKNNYRKVVEILNELLTHYPKKTYWTQLSSMQGELKEDAKQLSAYETAYVQGLLDKEQELVRMAYLFLGSDVPYKAAKVLDKGIKEKTIEPTAKNLELLGASWRQSQEIKKAIPEMAKAAAKSDKGELWSTLCNIYLDGDEFKKAVDACKKGITKGGLRRSDTTNLVLGMAYFNLKQYDSARKAFNVAKKDKRSEKYASQWIGFMDRELARQKSLEQI